MRMGVQRLGPLVRLSDAFWRNPRLLAWALLAPPLLWLGIVCLAPLLLLPVQGLFAVDDASGRVDYVVTLRTYAALLTPADVAILRRTVVMAALVTLAAAVLAFPIAYYAARYLRGRWKAAFYLAVTLPLWSGYLVKVQAWKLILAEDGMFAGLNLGWLAREYLILPGVGGASLAASPTGTFLAFLYAWLPFMILPIQAALERLPPSMIEASGDLGALPLQTFRHVILPLAMPGVIVGSVFTVSLTLGDYIVPKVLGASGMFLGQAVFDLQETAGNAPLAAAFATVPVVVAGLYLWWARRMGAFDAP